MRIGPVQGNLANQGGGDLADFRLTRNGSPLSLTGVNLAGTASDYTLELSVLTSNRGDYVLSLVAPTSTTPWGAECTQRRTESPRPLTLAGLSYAPAHPLAYRALQVLRSPCPPGAVATTKESKNTRLGYNWQTANSAAQWSLSARTGKPRKPVFSK